MRSAPRFDQTGSVRLFDNALLERLSHAAPMTLAIFWSSISLVCVTAGCLRRPPGVMEFGAALVATFLGWTLFEYCIHRFLFHIGDRFHWAQRLSFILHGCHHADPGDATRNLMPLIASVPAFIVFFAGFAVVLPFASVLVLFGFLGFSYLTYDLTHYACHQRPMNNPLGRLLKARHLRHHFRNPTKDFAVTLPLWDRVFGTADGS